ncbi:predicted protein [Arabidopsis lyrata subsp. lyrata]|uniref:Predicted protein n=1 Tax=Arabidopsis lyrata subsp. lyrata TaxID=81972 RepID=D7KW71_ARALL|nr:predicted protein [Arabidopsis lyrata subsp. lyrata]
MTGKREDRDYIFKSMKLFCFCGGMVKIRRRNFSGKISRRERRKSASPVTAFCDFRMAG